MGVFSGDAIIKTMVELAIDDLKKNSWIIDDIFSDFIENPYLKQKYGYAEIERAREFILNNKIHILLRHRLDNEELPCITISMGNSSEAEDLATLGDAHYDVVELSPDEINKPLSYIVPPINVISYDPLTGIVEIPETDSYNHINPDMIAVDTATGNGYIIQGKGGENGFIIEKDLDFSVEKIAVVPKYQVYRARKERIWSKEVYNIGCHAHGDPSLTLFLYAITKYALLRYREGLLEYQNFEVSSIQSTDFIKNDAFNTENVYSRFIVLSGQVEETWLKAPHQIIEAAGVDIVDEEDSAGIKIFSNEITIIGSEEDENDLWKTIKE